MQTPLATEPQGVFYTAGSAVKPMDSSTLHRYDLASLKCVRSYWFDSESELPYSHADVSGSLIQATRSLARDSRGIEVMHFDVGQSLEEIFQNQDREYLYYDHHGYGREHLPHPPKAEIAAAHANLWTPFTEEIAISLFLEGLEEAKAWLLDRCGGRFWEEAGFSWQKIQDELNADLGATVGWQTEGVPFRL